MKKFCFSLSLLLGLIPSAFALRPQTRVVEVDTVAHCSMQAMESTVSRFCYEFQADVDMLFEWAYLNTDGGEEEKTGKGKDAVRLEYRDRTYDPVAKTGDVAINIYVLGSRLVRDAHLGTQYSAHSYAPGKLEQRLDATYSGSLLDGAMIRFEMDSISPVETAVHYTFSISFGRFLAQFISDKTWAGVAEWRLRAIFDNLVEFAETGTVSTPKNFAPK